MHRLFALLCALGVFMLVCSTTSAAVELPAPLHDEALASAPAHESITVAGGCFWGVQAVFQHVKGVVSATSGYSGGDVTSPSYEQVCTGTTGHAEAVDVVYDPSKVTLGKLLQVFFSVAHDPTELNRQGPDHGTQYRSAIFYSSPQQQAIIQDYVAQLNAAKLFDKPIVTEVAPLKNFYRAEDYHQDYATLHPENRYIVTNDAPKVANLKRLFPDLYTEKR